MFRWLTNCTELTDQLIVVNHLVQKNSFPTHPSSNLCFGCTNKPEPPSSAGFKKRGLRTKWFLACICCKCRRSSSRSSAFMFSFHRRFFASLICEKEVLRNSKWSRTKMISFGQTNCDCRVTRKQNSSLMIKCHCNPTSFQSCKTKSVSCKKLSQNFKPHTSLSYLLRWTKFHRYL